VFRRNPLHTKCWYIVGFATTTRTPRQTSLLSVNLPGLELAMFHPTGHIYHASRSAGFRDLHLVPSPEGSKEARQHLELFQQRQQQQRLKDMLDAAAKGMDLSRLSADEQAEFIGVLERMQRLSTKQRTYPLPGHKRDFI
jgi:hypothetical protein